VSAFDGLPPYNVDMDGTPEEIRARRTQREAGTPPSDQPFSIDLNGCARCHGDGHERLWFEVLTYPMEVGGVVMTHWASCPENGEPILLTIHPD
jgi:hypothetical protein